jgi:RNA polymerase sigma factor (sigma-70 family)
VTPWALIRPARLAGSRLLRTQSDARLVELVRAGNDRAFEAIVLRYHKPLLRHCRRMLPAGRAEDAVQTVFLRALEAIRADRRELHLRAWLHRIARNTAIDALRRVDSHWEELDDTIDGVEPAHAAAERRARFRSVVAGVGALPERQRRALVLRELEGRSYEEIAATLGVSGAGVRQLLNRARNAMRVGAGALLPPALLAKAKATAAVAAGTVALVAMNAPGDRVRLPHAEAKPRPPVLESRADAGGSANRAKAAQAGAGSRRAIPPDRTRRHNGRPRGRAGEPPEARLGIAVPSGGSGVDRLGTDEAEWSEPRSRSRPVGAEAGGGQGQLEHENDAAAVDATENATGGPLEEDDDAKAVVDEDDALEDVAVADAADAPDDDPSTAGAGVPEGEDAVVGEDDDPVASEPEQVPESPPADSGHEVE